MTLPDAAAGSLVPADSPLVDLPLERLDGSAATLAQWTGHGPLALVLVRHLACLFCSQHLFDLRAIHGPLRELGGEIIVIAAATPRHVAHYADRQGHPFPVLADPQRRVYSALALGRLSSWSMLRVGLVARYFGLLLRGWRQRLTVAEDDPLQAGGNFVLDGRGQLRWSYAITSPDDRPSPARVLDEARRAITGP